MAPPSSSAMSNLSREITLPPDAQDTISSVSWSPTDDHLAAASWDGKMRVYALGTSPKNNRCVATLAAEAPLFDCHWALDGTMVTAACADKNVYVLHGATGQQRTLGSHDAPVHNVRFVNVPSSQAPIIASGSWDKTVRFWDLRQSSPVVSITCQDRVYAMDAKLNLLVVATAGEHVHLINLRNPTTIAKTMKSALEYQTKSVSVVPDGKGWATSTIGGYCCISALDEADPSKAFLKFRCHRDTHDAQNTTKVWAVNSVQCHPTRNYLLATAGADGKFQFFDIKNRRRIGHYPPVGNTSITSTAFSPNGGFFAYAVGYDWSKGHSSNLPTLDNKLVIHPLTKDERLPMKMGWGIQK
ncbi:WD40 repeat-like protein [Hypoxylon sp. NC1633]|nr:WD40 repeat-like protein [Hypoxylon sp. NC1633]